MSDTDPVGTPDPDLISLSTKLWVYTNYDCNLSCNYCVAESHPRAPRRALDLRTLRRIVDEAVALGFSNLLLTGGEPLILDDIFEMVAYASTRLPTTILTNAMLLRGRRLQQLVDIKSEYLTIQVSLDGSHPEHHDPYRGRGTWRKTIDAIQRLLDIGFHVRLSTTETPANSGYMDEICDYCRSLGIAEVDHVIRPLAKRGFSDDGLEIHKKNLIPEMTINAQGVYWHPLSTDPDLLVSPNIFPLAESLSKIKTTLKEFSVTQDTEMQEFQ